MRPARPSSRGTEHQDPLTDNARGAVGRGAAFAAPPAHFELGTVAEVDAQRHMYRVALHSGRVVQMARIKAYPGDSALLPVGTQVAATFAYGAPYIIGIMPDEGRAPDPAGENAASVTDVVGHGGEDPMLNGNLGASARGAGEPRDILPGDFSVASPDGASVSALHGQVAQIKGSALAKVQAFGRSDLVQIISGVFRHVTWMGESKIINEDGKTSFIWEGGSDQLTQTGADEERFPIKLEVGHAGGLIRLEVKNREGQTLFRFHVGETGALEIYAAGGVNQHAGATGDGVHADRHHGSREEEITGGRTSSVGGDVLETVGRSYRREISVGSSEVVGQDQKIQVNRHRQISVGGNLTTSVTADYVSISAGRMLHQVNGGQIYEVKTQGGEIKFATNGGKHSVLTAGANIELNPAGGHFKVLTTGPDSIHLGSNPQAHAVRWEELNAALTPIINSINAMRTLLASHVHPNVLPAPPSLTSPTLAPVAAALPFSLEAARSRKVRVE